MMMNNLSVSCFIISFFFFCLVILVAAVEAASSSPLLDSVRDFIHPIQDLLQQQQQQQHQDPPHAAQAREAELAAATPSPGIATSHAAATGVLWHRIPVTEQQLEATGTFTFSTSFILSRHTYHAFQIDLNGTHRAGAGGDYDSSGAAVNVDLVVNLERTAVCEEDIYANMTLRETAPDLMPWKAPAPSPPSLRELLHALSVVPVTKTMQCRSISDVQRSFQNIVPDSGGGGGGGQDVFVLIQSLSRGNTSSPPSAANSSELITSTTTTTTTTFAPSTSTPSSSSSRCQVNVYFRVQRSVIWRREVAAALTSLALVVILVPVAAFIFVWRRARNAVANHGAILAATTAEQAATGTAGNFIFLWHIQRRLSYGEVCLFFPRIIFFFIVKYAVRLGVFIVDCTRQQQKRIQKMKRQRKKRNKRLRQQQQQQGAAGGGAANDDDEDEDVSCCETLFFCCCPCCGGDGGDGITAATAEGDEEASSCCCACWCCGKKSENQNQQRAHQQQQQPAGSSPNPSMVDLETRDAPSAAADNGAQQQQTPAAATMSDDEDEELCRICADDDAEEELIKPCSCTSSVHQSCLDRWRTSTTNQHASRSRCEICLAEFRVPISRMVIFRVIGMRLLHFFVVILTGYLVIVASFGYETLVAAPMACAAPFEKIYLGPLSDVSVYVIGGFTYISTTIMAFIAIQAAWLVHFNAPIARDTLLQYAGQLHATGAMAGADDADVGGENVRNNDDNNDNNDGEEPEAREPGVAAAAALAQVHGETAPPSAPETDDDDENRALLRRHGELQQQSTSASTTPTNNNSNDAAAAPPAAAAASTNTETHQQQQVQHQDQEQHDPTATDMNLDERQLTIILDMVRLDRVQDVRPFLQSRASRLWFLVFLLWQFLAIIWICLAYKNWAYRYSQAITWSWSVPFGVMLLALPGLMAAGLVIMCLHTLVVRCCCLGGRGSSQQQQQRAQNGGAGEVDHAAARADDSSGSSDDEGQSENATERRRPRRRQRRRERTPPAEVLVGNG